MNTTRNDAARRSLDGLSVGDAFGECFFAIAANPLSLEMHLTTRTLPNVAWRWTDDTAMAAAVVEVWERHGEVDRDDLAAAFAARYVWDDRRGYGATAHWILMAIAGGRPWSEVSPAARDGQGSLGNGGAMRVAPLGAYLSEEGETAELVEQARRSAEVTHAHPEGQAGAIAIALGAAFFGRHSPGDKAFRSGLFEHVLRHTPDCRTREGVARARDLPSEMPVGAAAAVLGNGSALTAMDTVPFCLWSAARAPADFERAMWDTVSAGGDMDTNCAIVGGLIAAHRETVVPAEWLARREALPLPLGHDSAR